jgi:hypothetical protein
MQLVKEWFRRVLQEPLLKNGISVELRTVRVNNSLKKPGPVFLEMARAAYEDGAEFFYRVNDDTELVNNWAKTYVTALRSFDPPLAIVGPDCGQGNPFILTHDFVHRIHMEIFEMNYYPPQLTDWWMDDWISMVYGRKRTFKARSVEVVHHVKHHGQRYLVDRANEQNVKPLVKQGRNMIRKWMLKNKYPESELKGFDADIELYSKSHEFLDVPKTTGAKAKRGG